MKRRLFILSAILLIIISCTKKESTRTSGTDVIDNTTYFSTTYYNYGFSFSEAKLVATTLNPGPDIAIYVNVDNVTPRLTLQTNNFSPSFFKVGEYPNEDAAKTAFDNLKTVSVDQWAEMADPIAANQVWIYKSGTENYTKFRIVSTVSETRDNIPFGECTFQWVYQPDGTTTFP
jgi:hypothetical protein